MARIEGTTIPDNKKILYSLTYVHGIGLTSSKNILTEELVISSVFPLKVRGPELMVELEGESV